MHGCALDPQIAPADSTDSAVSAAPYCTYGMLSGGGLDASPGFPWAVTSDSSAFAGAFVGGFTADAGALVGGSGAGESAFAAPEKKLAPEKIVSKKNRRALPMQWRREKNEKLSSFRVRCI
jgi:hypothetical protein